MPRIYFKENLARLRKNNKLSQDQLGKIVGKSHNAIPSETDIITDKMDEILKKST